MKKILSFVCFLIMAVLILNASPELKAPKAATHDITGLWRIYWDDYCEGEYYFDGEYLKFIGNSNSGTWAYYWGYECNYDDEYTYRVDNSTLTLIEYGYDVITGTFEDKNTIIGTLDYGYGYTYCLKLERVVADQNPFGSFDLPSSGATVSGSIPISGWVLDDTMIMSIRIYYSDVSSAAADSKNWRLIANDVKCLWGARPDVAYRYWDNYYCEWAGWGHMCLTYFLPNGGIGPFMLHIVATDIAGNTTTWSVTLYGDNANRVKPFGAIDTPEQCGWADVYASENYLYRNWGWALTPMPNSIPANGIGVYVDGVNLGNATYNINRSDIESFFPGYANSSGAGGYFDIDLSIYEDYSQHTLCWIATDSAGNKDGIGSRYFYVSKWNDTWSAATSKTTIASIIKKKRAREMKKCSGNQFADISVNWIEPISIKKGFKENVEYSSVFPDEAGINRIKIRTGERIEIKISGNKYTEVTGYMVLNKDELGPLPIGSTLDAKKGIFYWMPGPGFIGEYQFVFVVKGPNEAMIRKNIIVTIIPKFTIER